VPQEGYIVLRLDNRGSARRGTVFEQALHGSLGIAEVDDQIDGARFLIKRGLADAKRVGVIGWSYGGYLALLCLARAKELFKAAVAGAPVTDWGMRACARACDARWAGSGAVTGRAHARPAAATRAFGTPRGGRRASAPAVRPDRARHQMATTRTTPSGTWARPQTTRRAMRARQ
jgi:dienelactone hydrolase